MKKVITYGTFDLLHYGHILLLQRAKELGDHLTVGLSTDHFNEIKGKTSYFTYEERKMMLEAIKYVDLVIPEYEWEQKSADIQEHQINTFVMGDDWAGKFDDLKQYCEVIYLARTPDVSTTSIKSNLQNGHEQSIRQRNFTEKNLVNR
ncbi:glycerol-3-phosphate cytidylyltransferase [Paenibacillus medicaginis]|uniref:Glycerol-3-phosphate cytidylyltransferase n=1 Tax=Paenibacillus medicaginis TaxID=1470560 RepID=A0ABV5BX47_9BACL